MSTLLLYCVSFTSTEKVKEKISKICTKHHFINQLNNYPHSHFASLLYKYLSIASSHSYTIALQHYNFHTTHKNYPVQLLLAISSSIMCIKEQIFEL